MVYHLLYPLYKYFTAFNVFRYITVRAGGAALTSLILSIVLGPIIIKRLKKAKVGDTIRDLPMFETLHKHKIGIPTMGGVLILLVLIVSTLLWARLDNAFILIMLASTVYLGLLGFTDDYMKLKHGKRGLRGWYKLLAQAALGFFVGMYIFYSPSTPDFSNVTMPFFKNVFLQMGILYVVFVAVVITGSSNAVNLTDGQDGLAIGSVVVVAATLAVFVYLAGHFKFSDYLFIPFVPQSGELAVYLAALIGASLGFLWFNSYPAEILMGDTGALAIGGVLGLVAVLARKEMILLIVGGIFVVETVSVIIQVLIYKITKKRVFGMAPLHHHFELKGLTEPKIVVRFWIINIILALITFSTLKLR